MLPRGPEPPLDLDVEAEPVPGGSIRLDWTEPLSPQVHLRYRIPGMGHPDRPVFDLIAALLSGPHGMAGQAVAASGASASVAADFRVIHTYRFGSPGAFNLVAHAETDSDLAAVERGLLAFRGRSPGGADRRRGAWRVRINGSASNGRSSSTTPRNSLSWSGTITR